MRVLEAFAEKVGVKVLPAGKRGEVILSFPSCEVVDTFSLRLSKKKAFFLVSWLVYSFKKNEKEG
jgi:hypothetical protein